MSPFLAELVGTLLLVVLGDGVVANVLLTRSKGHASGLIVITTGWAINPARDLGPRLAHFVLPIAGKGGSDWSYAWIPVAGPVIGGIIAAQFYKGLWPA